MMKRVRAWMDAGSTVRVLNRLCAKAYAMAKQKGWYPDERRNIGEAIALMHSELSEAMEAYRDGQIDLVLTASGKPEGLVVELADAVIRIADLCGFLRIDLGDAVLRKMTYNATRPTRHGGKRA